MLASWIWPVRAVRLLLGGLALLAVGTQFTHEATLPGFSPVNFFSYFTILSNIAVGLLLVALGALPGTRHPRLEWVRAAMVVYMATTGLVYAILLDTGDPGLTLPWVNTVLHRVMPAALFVDWLVIRPQRHLGYGKALAWSGVPVLYLAYSLVRGAVIGWYPYPFLQPVEVGGVAGMLVHILGIAAGIAAASLLVAWLGNVRVQSTQMRAAA
ncbi:hypothetical protein DFQ14_108146 [Halopolyspora algeriensis]|uniref:FAR-17a/AIG1-like protein n=1 Tax=Halopolyspora algeriensis TaxID=1500506 RepID=A0A368VSE0_9ACTN|nr:Pr6Pr family membrane protein [Halopolyspora algeriensis]RCW42886.1 hypothetical protein DFQ14_108146 [Halopolyspora algeriensis]TQM56645.1 hypothetical protein FHU43_1453 [Halopolyspora algeriensis]